LSIQDALAAISKTFELEGLDNPLYQSGSQIYHFPLDRQKKLDF